jgi:hypothetical protein
LAQSVGAWHTWPQPPQLFGSVATSSQSPLQQRPTPPSPPRKQLLPSGLHGPPPVEPELDELVTELEEIPEVASPVVAPVPPVDAPIPVVTPDELEGELVFEVVEAPPVVVTPLVEPEPPEHAANTTKTPETVSWRMLLPPGTVRR